MGVRFRTNEVTMRNGLAIVPRNAPNRNVCQYSTLTPFDPPLFDPLQNKLHQ